MSAKNNPERSAALIAAVSALLASAAATAQDQDAATASDASAELEPVVIVVGDRIRIDTIPGSAVVLDQSTLEEAHVLNG